MPVSPRDFELYSRMTGKPMPMDAQQRMQMAPEVFQFTRNFAKRPNILEKTGNLIKNIGKTTLMGAAGLAAAPAFVEQQETTADNYAQDRVENQTASNTILRSGTQQVDLENNKTIAENVVETQSLTPDTPVDSRIIERADDLAKSTGDFDATPKKSEEQILSEMKQYEEQAGLTRIGGPANVTEEVDKFVNKFGGVSENSKLDPLLLAALQNRGQEEELVSTSFPIASRLTDNPQSALDGGQSTRAESREFIKETEPIDSGVPTNVDPSTLTPEVKAVLSNIAQGMATIPLEKQIQVAKEMVGEKNMMDSPNEEIGKLKAEVDRKEQANQNLLDFVKTLGGEPTQEQKIEADQANSRILQKTAAKQRMAGMQTPLTDKYYPSDVARSDIQVGGLRDRKTGIGRSVGISYTPQNGDTKVGFNIMKDPTDPSDYDKTEVFDFTAPPETIQSMGSKKEGELGALSFGKLFNVAKQRNQGFQGV